MPLSDRVSSKVGAKRMRVAYKTDVQMGSRTRMRESDAKIAGFEIRDNSQPILKGPAF